jgi:hypothetical protein
MMNRDVRLTDLQARIILMPMRRQLREKADEAPGRSALGPREALALLKTLEAPIAPVETMVEESVAGRYS